MDQWLQIVNYDSTSSDENGNINRTIQNNITNMTRK